MSRAWPRRGWTPLRLGMVLGALWLALALPSAVLLLLTQRQMQWEAYHQQRGLAEELTERIDGELQRLIAVEEARGFADYQFLIVAGDPNVSRQLQRSPLAELLPAAALPGAIGYFQIDASGEFSTPLLPQSLDDPAQLGLSSDDLQRREARAAELYELLSRNRLVQRPRFDDRRTATLRGERNASEYELDARSARPAQPAPAAAEPLADYAQNQAAFDRLSAAPGKQAELKKETLEGKLDAVPGAPAVVLAEEQAKSKDAPVPAEASAAAGQLLPQRSKRREQTALPEVGALQRRDADEKRPMLATPVRIFESELDPFEFARLDSGHFVLYRKVWRGGQRIIQGLLIEPAAFIDGVFVRAIAGSALAQISALTLDWRGESLRWLPPSGRGVGVTDRVLLETRLSAPLADLGLRWSIGELPPGPGARLIGWTGLVLFAVLIAGFAGLYALGLRQLRLARQQQNFVAAVSHELKTPLTSIRMYGEILREGWASESKRREYYDYIVDESERLSRLIGNVLQLARMERNELKLELKRYSAALLLDLLRSKLAAPVARAGFAIDYQADESALAAEVSVDADAFVQIVLNLVDNALKFAARSEPKRIELGLARLPNQQLEWRVRDFGPGIGGRDLPRVFELFYRAGNEATRDTVGTGIGLALVRQLARALGGEVEAGNRQPGAEFRLRLPCLDQAGAT